MGKSEKLRFFTLPNILTLANLACGCLATLYALRFDDLQIVFWLVMAAAVFDFLDGFAARLTGQYSALGRELDSLADMVSFGLVPGAVLFSLYQGAGGIGTWGFSAFVVVLFSALRLAKFNIDDAQHDEFIGLPTPANAILIASAGSVFASGLYVLQPWMVLAAGVVLSYLLICPVRMFSLKFKGFRWRGNQLRYIFLVVALGAVVAFGIPAVPFVMAGYILTSLVRNVVCVKCPR